MRFAHVPTCAATLLGLACLISQAACDQGSPGAQAPVPSPSQQPAAAAGPDAAKPDAPQPDAPKPDAPKPDAPKPDAALDASAVEPPISDEELAARERERERTLALPRAREASPLSPMTTRRVTLPQTPQDPVLVEGNPYVFDDRVPALIWVNNPTTYKVYAQPDERAAVAGQLKLPAEDTVEWLDARYVLAKPRPFVARQDVTLRGPGLRQVDPSHRFGHGPALDALELKAGQVYELFMHSSDGACLGRVQSRFIWSPCPTPDAFSCEVIPRDHASAPMAPIEQLIWFKVKHPSAEGWLRFDKTELSLNLKKLDWSKGAPKGEDESPPPAPDYAHMPDHLQPPPEAQVFKPKPVQIQAPPAP